MFEIDNRNGTDTVYFIVDIAPLYGIVEVGQVSNSIFEFVEYINKEIWLSDLQILGIDISKL